MASWRHKYLVKTLSGLVLLGIAVYSLLIFHTIASANPRRAFTHERTPCHVAIVSTFPPRTCGIAEYTRSLVDVMERHDVFAATCDLKILALVEPKEANEEELHNPDPRVVPLVVDSAVPSRSFWNATEYLNHGGFTHVILQHEFRLTPNRWQLVDMARWLRPSIMLISVIHSPLAHPNLEETGVLRELARFSKWVVTMSWHGVHSLHYAYGIDPSKVIFIPRGVALPSASSINRNSMLKLDDAQLLILCDGQTRLDQLVRVLPSIVMAHPSVRLYAVGRANPSDAETGRRKMLLQKAADLGVGGHVQWIDQHVTNAQLAEYFRRCDLYVSLVDDNTPISTTLLTAMAHGLAIVSTPHRFAMEMLRDERGLVVPIDDDTAIINAVLQLLYNPSLRSAYGRRAREFVQSWQWDHVAALYANLILGRDKASPDPRLSEEDDVSAMKDPFDGESPLEILENPALWSRDAIRTFDERVFQLRADDRLSGVYVLYVDHCLQINAKIETNLLFSVVAIRTPTQWLYAHSQHGVDYERVGAASVSPPNADKVCGENVEVDLAQQRVVISSENVKVEVNVAAQSRGVSVSFLAVSRFAAPRGLIGDTLQCRHDRLVVCQGQRVRDLGWDSWVVRSGLLFSHEVDKQVWSGHGISVNLFAATSRPLPARIFENNDEARRAARRISFYIEGCIFRKVSLDIVNRRMWFMLQGQKDRFRVLLRPADTITEANAYESLDIYLLFSAYREQQEQETHTANVGNNSHSSPYHVLFRFQYPPNFTPPSQGAEAVYIHQQPWEFVGIPTSWREPLLNLVDELWVPSQYCRESYKPNGIPVDKIAVIPHGVSWDKWARVPAPTTSSELLALLPQMKTSTSFKFLVVSGSQVRKGIDVLLKAYENTFTAKDDVTLIVHSNYGNEFDYHIKRLLAMENAPELIFTNDSPSWYELARLFKSVHVYVSPYRSEGFGMTILEAMAAGLPLIVPAYGPAIEFCTNDNAFFIRGTPTPCCGIMTLFGVPTVVQPQWVEPSVEDLGHAMRTAYQNRTALVAKAVMSTQMARERGWDTIAPLVIKRIYHLVERKYGITLGELDADDKDNAATMGLEADTQRLERTTKQKDPHSFG